MASQEPIPDLPDVPRKTCTKCGETQPETEFYLKHDARHPLRRSTSCHTCDRARARRKRLEQGDTLNAWRRQRRQERRDIVRSQLRQSYQKHREQRKADRREYYQKNRAEIRRKAAIYQQTHREKIRAYQRVYCEANREKVRTRNSLWRKNNPAKAAQSFQQMNQKRRTRKYNLPIAFSREDEQFCRQYFSYACAYCGNEEGFVWTIAMDHFFPLSDPSSPGTVPSNIVPACHGDGGCNNRKHRRAPGPWLEDTFGARQAKAILKKIDAYFQVVRERSTCLMPHKYPSDGQEGN